MRVLIDANVFVTPWVLDVILTLADAELLEVRWSCTVLDEASKAHRMLGRFEQWSGLLSSMQKAFPDALVEGWEGQMGDIVLPDSGDHHVAAAAIVGECDCIVTFNLRDFPAEILGAYDISVLSPDALIVEVAQNNPRETIRAMEGLVQSKRRPPRSWDEEINGLRIRRLPKFADWLDTQIPDKRNK